MFCGTWYCDDQATRFYRAGGGTSRLLLAYCNECAGDAEAHVQATIKRFGEYGGQILTKEEYEEALIADLMEG